MVPRLPHSAPICLLLLRICIYSKDVAALTGRSYNAAKRLLR